MAQEGTDQAEKKTRFLILTSGPDSQQKSHTHSVQKPGARPEALAPPAAATVRWPPRTKGPDANGSTIRAEETRVPPRVARELRVMGKEAHYFSWFYPHSRTAGKRAPGKEPPPPTDRRIWPQHFVSPGRWLATILHKRLLRVGSAQREFPSHSVRKENPLLSSSPFAPAPLDQPRRRSPKAGPLAKKRQRAAGWGRVTWVQKVQVGWPLQLFWKYPHSKAQHTG